MSVYDNWSRDASATVDGTDVTVRLYQNRTKVDLASYYEGRAPERDDGVALDATFCSHHGVGVGDTIWLGGRDFTVCGIMVLPDYTALMRSNGDFVMDSIAFCVGLVSDAASGRLSELPTAYTYFLVFDDDALSTSDRVSRETDVAQTLVDGGSTVTGPLDREQNQGISYLPTDTEGDGAFYTAFLYVLIAIMAFVFVVLINATVECEASVIGTLLASGWRWGTRWCPISGAGSTTTATASRPITRPSASGPSCSPRWCPTRCSSASPSCDSLASSARPRWHSCGTRSPAGGAATTCGFPRAWAT